MTKVSIIIPIYNGSSYISRCFDSIINQTYTDIEIICINDYSKDNSLEILEKYSQKDDRIKIVNNEKNLGVSLTRNVGINLAKGEYLYFLDVDDYIDEKYIECMVEKIEQQNCDIVLNLSVMQEINGKSTLYKHPSMPAIRQDGNFLDNITITHDAPCFIWARLYKKSFIDKYNLKFLPIITAEDVIFNAITNMYTDKTFVFCGEKYHYVVYNNSVSGGVRSERSLDLVHMQAHRLIYDYLNEHNKLNDKLKLFRVYPFIKVDTEEKFNIYKNFFEKIEANFHKNESIYNEMEKYFAYSLLNSPNYDEYLKNYNKVVTIGYLRSGKINERTNFSNNSR
ncbi:glycosyltransferase family 2 protein [bacterium]|nr:glycosyltransferase family 2 protein [bacterium]